MLAVEKLSPLSIVSGLVIGIIVSCLAVETGLLILNMSRMNKVKITRGQNC